MLALTLAKKRERSGGDIRYMPYIHARMRPPKMRERGIQKKRGSREDEIMRLVKMVLTREKKRRMRRYHTLVEDSFYGAE